MPPPVSSTNGFQKQAELEETKESERTDSEPSVRMEQSSLPSVKNPLPAMSSGVNDTKLKRNMSIKETFEVFDDIDIGSTSFPQIYQLLTKRRCFDQPLQENRTD